MSASASTALAEDQAAEHAPNGLEGTEQPVLFSPAGLEALYRRQSSRLIQRLARRLGRAEASDIVHEAFVKLADARMGASGPVERPDALAATVAMNVLRDRARAAARQALQKQQLGTDFPVEAHDPHRYFESREALRAIERALAGMNPRRRRIFVLHRFEHMSYAEIGRAVGMSEKGVKKQIAKALVVLRRATGPL